MKKVAFILLICVSSLFAGQNDFLGVLQQILEAAADGQQTSSPQQKATSKSLSEEAADKKAIEQRQKSQKSGMPWYSNIKIKKLYSKMEFFLNNKVYLEIYY